MKFFKTYLKTKNESDYVTVVVFGKITLLKVCNITPELKLFKVKSVLKGRIDTVELVKQKKGKKKK